MKNPSLIALGIAGLSTPQLWVVIILAQVGVLLWITRRISSYAGLHPGAPSSAVESEGSRSDWESRMVSHRLKQLKVETFESLQNIPGNSLERLTAHNGWRTSLKVSREVMPNGRLLVTVARVEKNSSRNNSATRHSFIAHPDGTKEEVLT